MYWSKIFFLLTLFSSFMMLSTTKGNWIEECTSDGPLSIVSNGDFLPTIDPRALNNRDFSDTDWKLTASSSSKTRKNCEANYARVYARGVSSWCALEPSSSDWLQIDLGIPAQVTGVMTQGRNDGREWVRSFKLSHSLDGSHYEYVTDIYGNQRIFDGNVDSFTVKHNYLDKIITARFVKFHVLSWEGHPSLRVEIIGCQACKSQLAVPPYLRISSSSSRGRKRMKTCTNEYGHIYSGKAWCAKQQNVRQYMELDIGPPTLIYGIITMGRGDTRRNHWVSEYRLSFSNDSKRWMFYKEAVNLDPKNFPGNSDKNSPKVNFLLTPIIASKIRIHPLKWNGRISMRAGLYGCKFQGECGTGYFRINGKSSCVTNLAYVKSAWINQEGARHRKRHLSSSFSRTQSLDLKMAAKAVDGRLSQCAVLKHDKQYYDVPTWTVNLGPGSTVSGVVIHTDVLHKNGSAGSPESRLKMLQNLDRILVYASVNPPQNGNQLDVNSRDLCGLVTHYNEALLKAKIHVQCRKPMKARYVYIQPKRINDDWNKEYGAVLCEVNVY